MAASQEHSDASRPRPPPPPAVPSRNNAALGLIGGAFVGVVAFTAPFVFMQLRSSLPYMATPRHKVERALEFIASKRASSGGAPGALRRDAQRQLSQRSSSKELNFVDLGSGDGTTVLAAASLGWKATGLELNPTLWFVSSVRRFFSPVPIRAKSQFVLGDMFKSATAASRLRRSDCVMVFGVQSLMPQIADLVGRECAPGCYLMSYRFRVPLLDRDDGGVAVGGVENESASSSPSGGIDASLVYDEEEMRIYELNCPKKVDDADS